VQPALFIYCFGRLTKVITDRLLVVCRKWLHLVITFQEDGPPSTTLLQVTIQIINNATCNNNYAAYGGITPRMICAGVPDGSKDACEVTGSW